MRHSQHPTPIQSDHPVVFPHHGGGLQGKSISYAFIIHPVYIINPHTVIFIHAAISPPLRVPVTPGCPRTCPGLMSQPGHNTIITTADTGTNQGQLMRCHISLTSSAHITRSNDR